MKKLFVLTICLLAAQSLLAWGQKGHDVTAFVAENHLTPEAAEKIDKVLDGHSLVYYSSWMDVASHSPEYAYTKTWHYLNIDNGETYETMTKAPSGDIFTALTSIVEKLKAGGLSADDEALQLKMLIHLMGDMHCPMHTAHRSDLGGNRIPVMVFNTPSNLHSAWDGAIPEATHRWSYSEWQNQIDRLSDDEVVLVQAGDMCDWLIETHEICLRIYDETPEGTKISFDYIDRYTPIVEAQLLKGGYRLARILNEIYQ